MRLAETSMFRRRNPLEPLVAWFVQSGLPVAGMILFVAILVYAARWFMATGQ